MIYEKNILPAFSYIILLITSLIFAFWWTSKNSSLGAMAVYKTNKFLKNRPELHSEFQFFSFSGIFLFLVFVLNVLLGSILVDINLYLLFSSQGLSGAKRIFSALLQPNWSIIVQVLSSMVDTIYIAFLATFIAVPIAFFFSFFAARNLASKFPFGKSIYTVIRFFSNFTRSVEPLVWAVIFSVWVGVGPFAGMLALSIHSVSSLIKLYSEQIESVSKGPLEAIESTGAHPVLVIWYAVVPQIILPYLSFTIYRWDINIRMATVIGLVGGGGIGTLLVQYQGLAQWNEVGTIVIVIASVVWLMDYLSAKLREAIY
ncbi:MAG: phosphonate ABC transporter, permease protein PhnE [Bdellovibrionaceae bacterium]|nr:phosphonate ABC transporter, permease protein PhnE [Pseudobdellovibrionaceae bacterium]